jgi:hypothetical protein
MEILGTGGISGGYLGQKDDYTLYWNIGTGGQSRYAMIYLHASPPSDDAPQLHPRAIYRFKKFPVKRYKIPSPS